MFDQQFGDKNIAPAGGKVTVSIRELLLAYFGTATETSVQLVDPREYGCSDLPKPTALCKAFCMCDCDCDCDSGDSDCDCDCGDRDCDPE